MADFQLGSFAISPSRRVIHGPGGALHLQPQVMIVFLCLARNEGKVVSRRTLFETCWGEAAVGDDSLNRTLSRIRNVLEAVGDRSITLETVPRTGYRLVTAAVPSASPAKLRMRATEAALDCWRGGIPKADVAEIDALETVLSTTIGDARDWGVLALLMRKAAEYAGVEHCGSYVSRCEATARRALADCKDSNARVALIGLTPLFGRWRETRRDLLAVLADDPGHVAARHDLAVLEMATGRPSAAIPLVEELIAEDPLAASFHYKRMYHLWTVGDLNGAEQVAARALQLWPSHPAIWIARFWILIFTSRAEQAQRLLLDHAWPPPIPDRAAEFLRETARVVTAMQAKTLSTSELGRHIAQAVRMASLGPAQAVLALETLSAVDAIDQAYEVARAYYLGDGNPATPLRWTDNDPSITDQHRRVTQPLFTPAARVMREDSRFLPLCEDMGLAAYWDSTGLTPDFLQPSTTAPPMVRE